LVNPEKTSLNLDSLKLSHAQRCENEDALARRHRFDPTEGGLIRFVQQFAHDTAIGHFLNVTDSEPPFCFRPAQFVV
jgi:hypothetical protein